MYFREMTTRIVEVLRSISGNIELYFMYYREMTTRIVEVLQMLFISPEDEALAYLSKNMDILDVQFGYGNHIMTKLIQ